MTTRREFLKAAIVLGGASSFAGAFLAGKRVYERTLPRRRVLLLGATGFPHSYENRKLSVARLRPGAVRIFDPAAGTIEAIPISFYPHGFCQSPIDPFLFATSQKWSTRAGIVDLGNHSVRLELECPEDYRFFGHGAYHPNGRTIYFSASRYTDDAGALVAYSTESGKLVSITETGGEYPHEILYDSGLGRILIVNNGHVRGGSLASFDPGSGKVETICATPKSAHLVKVSATEFVLGGLSLEKEVIRPELCLLNVRERQVTANYRNVAGAKLLPNGEALSLCAWDQESVVATIPDHAVLVKWNFRKSALMSVRMREAVYGVVPWEKELLVNGEQVSFGVSLEPNAMSEKPLPWSLGNGRHTAWFEIPKV